MHTYKQRITNTGNWISSLHDIKAWNYKCLYHLINDITQLQQVACTVLEITVGHWPFSTNFNIWLTKIHFGWPILLYIFNNLQNVLSSKKRPTNFWPLLLPLHVTQLTSQRQISIYNFILINVSLGTIINHNIPITPCNPWEVWPIIKCMDPIQESL